MSAGSLINSLLPTQFLNPVPVVDATSVAIEATARLNRQGLTADFARSGAIDVPWATLISTIIALELAGDDGGASVNDTRCTSRRDSTCRSEWDYHPGGELAPIACV